mgnify:CR=1 FL=1
MSTILKVEGLTKHFPGNKNGLFGKRDVVQAVDGVSFEIAAGEDREKAAVRFVPRQQYIS